MDRTYYLEKIDSLFENHKVVAILGPRQVGKTTLADFYSQRQKEVHKYDLENPIDLNLLENPMLLLENQTGLIVIDEIQRREDLFPVIRVLADQKNKDRKFLILGSASQELIKQSSETLAGRIAYIELPGFSLLETHETKKLWVSGGFPKAFLASSTEKRLEWIQHYVRNFLERDIPSFGINILTPQMRRLWYMLGHYNAKKINYSDLARSVELSSATIKRYVDILESTLMLQRLHPWHENISKRQSKAPKLIFKDSGILHYMLGLDTWDSLIRSPHLGFSWESFAIRQIILLNNFNEQDCYYWSTQDGTELDLFVFTRGKKLGFEFKFSESPSITKSMRIALKDLQLDSLTIVNPGSRDYQKEVKIFVKGLGN